MSDSEESPGFWLSPLQRRLVTTALAGLSVFVIGALLFGLFLLLNGFVQAFSGVLWPIAVAGILAMLLQPLVRLFEERTSLNRIGGIVLLYVLVTLAFAALLGFVLPLLVEQTVSFIRDFPSISERFREAFLEKFPQVMDFLDSSIGPERMAEIREKLEDRFQSLLESLPEQMVPVASKLGSYAGAIAGTAAGLAIIPVYVFFFLNVRGDKTRDIEKQLSWVKKDIREDVMFLGTHFAHSMEAFFRGQIVIGLIMGVLLGVGFSLAGVNFGFPLGLFIGLLNIIPYFGTMIGLATVLPIAWFQPGGGPLLAGIALAIFVAVQVIEGYFLTPRIMGNKTGLHPLTIIIAIFFWGTALGGILGMILAIPLTAFFVVAWRLLREKYLARWLDADQVAGEAR
ncbi:MAG: AI-2E family transporter [Puniceicoccaceae bacterium]